MHDKLTTKSLGLFPSLLAITGILTLLSACGGGDDPPPPVSPTATVVANINADGNDSGADISSNGLALYFQSDRNSPDKSMDLYIAKRNSTTDPWGTPTPLTSLNSAMSDREPAIMPDEKTIYFSSNRADSITYDIYVATRSATDVPWDAPAKVGTVINSTGNETGPSLSADGRIMVFCSDRDGSRDIFMATRTDINGPWDQAVSLTTINTVDRDEAPEITADGLTLYFASDRAGGHGDLDIWVSKRASTDADWGPPTPLPSPINSADKDVGPSITSDNKTLYFGSSRSGKSTIDIWQSNL